MAYNDFSTRYAKELNPITLFGSFVIGVSGAVVGLKGNGVKSVVKLTDAGAYEVELERAYKLLNVQLNLMSIVSTGSGICNIEVKETPANLQDDFRANGKFIIQCYDYAGNKANPAIAAGPLLSAINMVLTVRNSSNGPWD